MATETARVALFWEKTFLWGLIAFDTFRKLNIDFDLLSADDIRHGRLNDYDVLFVPGGWASDKIQALGEDGAEAIRSFVAGGGSYLGFCGGAGLALSHKSGLGLAMIGRLPSSVRVPSFSGDIALEPAAPDHPMWRGLPGGGVFHAWWPGQIAPEEGSGIRVLARYGEPGADAYVTDLPVLPQMDWNTWEQRYGINLDPRRLKGEPAVFETRFGEGKVFMSYPHFETPGDTEGHRVLLNILEYLADGKPVAITGGKREGGEAAQAGLEVKALASAIALALKHSVDELVDFGKQNFLWYERNDWILGWRRGVRGVEYSTLHAMLDRLAVVVPKAVDLDKRELDKLLCLRDLASSFFPKAHDLLCLERDAMRLGPISPLKTDDKQIEALREKLFSTSKRCGGLFEEIIDLADEILLPLLREELALEKKTGTEKTGEKTGTQY